MSPLDSIYSSTTNLARAEKKGLLGIFQFSRRKSKVTFFNAYMFNTGITNDVSLC